MGAGIGEQEAAVAVRAETELGDLLQTGEAAAQGAEATLRAGRGGGDARAGSVASEGGAAGSDVASAAAGAMPPPSTLVGAPARSIR